MVASKTGCDMSLYPFTAKRRQEARRRGQALAPHREALGEG